jgi:hypothetical protein
MSIRPSKVAFNVSWFSNDGGYHRTSFGPGTEESVTLARLFMLLGFSFSTITNKSLS